MTILPQYGEKTPKQKKLSIIFGQIKYFFVNLQKQQKISNN